MERQITMASFKYDWSGLSEIGANLYLKEELADVYFLVKNENGESEQIPAHKILLAAGSSGFNRMFYGKLKEKGNVEIVDVSAEPFKEFLQCFYTNKITLTVGNVAEVLYLSDKYDIDKCKAACMDLMQRKLNVDNVCQFFQLATLFNQTELKKTCEDFIGENTKEVLRSDGFISCKKKAVLDHILRRQAVSCSETAVFEACMAWVKRASNQQQVTRQLVQTHLGDLFREIRFRSMTLKEFSSLLPSYKQLFSGDEFSDILQMMADEQFEAELFNGLRRENNLYKWNEGAKIICNRATDLRGSSEYCLKNLETTWFTTNKPLLLGAIQCMRYFNQSVIPVEVSIQRNENQIPKILYHERFDLDFFSGRINLPKPILIHPEIGHEIQIRMNLPAQLSATSILKAEVNLESDIMVRFSKDPTTGWGSLTNFFHSFDFNIVKD